MSASSRKSLTRLRSCCKMFSAKTRVHVAWCMVSPAFRSAPPSSWKSSSRWRGERGSVMYGLTVAQRPVILVSCHVLAHAQGKGASRGTPDFLPHDTDRWALHLLPRGRPARRPDPAPPARTPLPTPHVP